MTCPKKKELLCYVSNEVAPDTRKALSAHIETCPTCAKEAAFLTAVANHVRSAPPSTSLDCPDEETLCAYVDGSLPKDQEIQCTKHILVCETCRRQADDVRLAALGGYAVPVSATRNWGRRVLQMAAAAAILLVVGFTVRHFRRAETMPPDSMPNVSYVTLFRGEATDIGNAMFDGKSETWTSDKVLTEDVLGLLQKPRLVEAEAVSLLKRLEIPQLRDISADAVVVEVADRLQTSASTGQPVGIVVEKRLGIYVVRIRSRR